MNFLKNSFNKFFGKNEDKKPDPPKALLKEDETDDSIPGEALVQLFQMTADFISESKYPAPDILKLQLYGLYKQATVGDCNTPKPAIYEFVAKAKWQAWDGFKGMSAANAMKNYMATAVQVDPNIPKRMALAFNSQDVQHQPQHQHIVNLGEQKEGSIMKMVEQKDYSDSYSHPYFKSIEKNEELPQITRQLLLQKNNNPAVYALHFAIDKEREDLVPKFLELLSVEDIQKMKDQEGTGILEYAELIENQAILQMVKGKLAK